MSTFRGKKVLRSLTLFGEVETKINDEEKTRGRDPELNAAKNELILHRIIYYRMDMRNSEEWIFKMIRREFFLTESTIGQLVEDNGDILHRIRKEINIKMLREKYDWIEWEKHPGIG